MKNMKSMSLVFFFILMVKPAVSFSFTLNDCAGYFQGSGDIWMNQVVVFDTNGDVKFYNVVLGSNNKRPENINSVAGINKYFWIKRAVEIDPSNASDCDTAVYNVRNSTLIIPELHGVFLYGANPFPTTRYSLELFRPKGSNRFTFSTLTLL